MMHCLTRWFAPTKGLHLLSLIPYIPFRESERQIHQPQYWNRINLVLLSVSPSTSLKQSQRLLFISGGYEVLGLIIVLWISTCIVNRCNEEISGEGEVEWLARFVFNHTVKNLFFSSTVWCCMRSTNLAHDPQPHLSLPLRAPSPSPRPLVSINYWLNSEQPH